ncbi:MAG: LamG-like jellyroll fold domain-containing protein [Phycisphaerales bacterium]
MSRISIVGVCAAAVCATAASAGLVFHFTGDGTLTDAAGGRNGTAVGPATYAAGLSGQAVDLPGNAYISYADDAAWTLGSGSFTVATWVNLDTVQAGSPYAAPNTFVGCDQGPGNIPKWVFFMDQSGTLYFHINGPGVIFLPSPGTASTTTGTWHHYAVVRQGSTFTFYGDGINLGSVSNNTVIPDPAAQLTIGQVENLGWLDGRVDDVQLYSRALSAAEISYLVAHPGQTAPAACPADIDHDGLVDGTDLGLLLGAWGVCGTCDADLNTDGQVDGTDLGLLLGAWGACP